MIKVFATQNGVFGNQSIMTAPLNLAQVVGTENPAYVGLTASTGGSRETTDIASWNFRTGTAVTPTATATATVPGLGLHTTAGRPRCPGGPVAVGATLPSPADWQLLGVRVS